LRPPAIGSKKRQYRKSKVGQNVCFWHLADEQAWSPDVCTKADMSDPGMCISGPGALSANVMSGWALSRTVAILSTRLDEVAGNIVERGCCHLREGDNVI
jgi:hypothetical protein